MALLVYVDDIIIVSNDDIVVTRLKETLDAKFKLKDLGSFRFFLELEIARSSKGIAVSQRPYALQILQDMGYLGCNPANTPMEANMKLIKDDGEIIKDPIVYRRMIGKLLYPTITRPALSYVVSR